MSATGLGWVLAILIGALAGWIASSLMKSNTGLFLNIVLGIVVCPHRVVQVDF